MKEKTPRHSRRNLLRGAMIGAAAGIIQLLPRFDDVGTRDEIIQTAESVTVLLARTLTPEAGRILLYTPNVALEPIPVAYLESDFDIARDFSQYSKMYEGDTEYDRIYRFPVAIQDGSLKDLVKPTTNPFETYMRTAREFDRYGKIEREVVTFAASSENDVTLQNMIKITRMVMEIPPQSQLVTADEGKKSKFTWNQGNTQSHVIASVVDNELIIARVNEYIR